MIVRPTPSELLDAVRRELKILASTPPAPDTAAAFGMIDSILQSVAFRTEHEAEWITEEVAAIEVGAENLVASGADHGGAVAAALAALRDWQRCDSGLTTLRIGYNLASELLSCALEAAMVYGGEIRDEIESLLAARMKREVEIRGAFSLEGRT